MRVVREYPLSDVGSDMDARNVDTDIVGETPSYY